MSYHWFYHSIFNNVFVINFNQIIIQTKYCIVNHIRIFPSVLDIVINIVLCLSCSNSDWLNLIIKIGFYHVILSNTVLWLRFVITIWLYCGATCTLPYMSNNLSPMDWVSSVHLPPGMHQQTNKWWRRWRWTWFWGGDWGGRGARWNWQAFDGGSRHSVPQQSVTGRHAERQAEASRHQSQWTRRGQRVKPLLFIQNAFKCAAVLSVISVFGGPSSQVNGKSYNQARLLLGSMGSLHPANRLAGYITGRLRVPTSVSLKVSQKIGLTDKIKPDDELRIKVAGTVVPPTVTARKTADLTASTQPPGKKKILPLTHTHTHTSMWLCFHLPC